jgi:hypothetical protein
MRNFHGPGMANQNFGNVGQSPFRNNREWVKFWDTVDRL